jgi:hypothetical protein
MKNIQIPRFVMLAALATAMALGVVVGKFDTGIAHANAATGDGMVGSYAFTVTLNPDDNLLEAFLVDTRSGAVYRGDYDSQKKDIIWIKYVSGKFRN